MLQIINRQKKGISVVITTLIIVVASVVLGTAVTLFATGLFGSSAGQTSLTTSNVKLWYNGTTTDQTVGAAVIRNTGDKILAVSSITIRGQNVPFANWYYNITGASSTNIQKQFAYNNCGGGAPVTCASILSATAPASGLTPGRLYTAWDLDKTNSASLTAPAGCSAATTCALIQATGPISLNPRTAVIVYFWLPTNPTVITAVDVGATATVSISAGSVSSVQSVGIAKAT